MKSTGFHDHEIHWILPSTPLPDWIYDQVQYQVSKFDNRDRKAILRF